MERAGKLLRKLKLAGESVSPEEVVRAAWPEAVGPQIARHTRVGSLKGTLLVIEASDPLFRQNLFSFRPVILKNIAAIAGPGLVTSIRIVVGAVRMPMRRAASTHGAADEAEQIRDSGLRMIYRHSRKRVS
jgi:predicted nucleic acid-binding Zn ribbon protein